MVPDTDFNLWLDEACRRGDTAALDTAAQELRAVVAGAFGEAHKAQTAAGRLRRVEEAISMTEVKL